MVQYSTISNTFLALISTAELFVAGALLFYTMIYWSPFGYTIFGAFFSFVSGATGFIGASAVTNYKMSSITTYQVICFVAAVCNMIGITLRHLWVSTCEQTACTDPAFPLFQAASYTLVAIEVAGFLVAFRLRWFVGYNIKTLMKD